MAMQIVGACIDGKRKLLTSEKLQAYHLARKWYLWLCWRPYGASGMISVGAI